METMRIRHGIDGGSECRIQEDAHCLWFSHVHLSGCGCRPVCRTCYTKWLAMTIDNEDPRCPWCRQACPVCNLNATPDWVLMAMLANTPAECLACHEHGLIGALRDGHVCLVQHPELSLHKAATKRKISARDIERCNNRTNGCNAFVLLPRG